MAKIRLEDKTIQDQIIEIALMLSLADLTPFTRKMILEHLTHLNKDSVNPMIQAMTVNAPGGPPIGPKYRKKVFRRVGRGQYELLDSVLSPEAKKRYRTIMRREEGVEELRQRIINMRAYLKYSEDKVSDLNEKLETVKKFVLNRRDDIEQDIEDFGTLMPVLEYFLGLLG